MTVTAAGRRSYFDHNASSPLRPSVRGAMAEALDLIGNPSSVHADGRAVRRAVDEARRHVARLAGVSAAEVVFTAGGTEANNLALRGFAGRRLIVSAVEHESVLAAAPAAARIPVDRNGVVDADALDRLLAAGDGPALVSVMLVNNETGVIQPVAEVARIARAHGAIVHCDAVQGAGRVPLDRAALGVDLLSLSAHKLGGPAGCGALVVAEGCHIEPLIRGGGQERWRRAGTENIVGIVGFGAAAAAALDDRTGPELAALRDDLERRALAAVPLARVMGAGAARAGNVACLALPGVAGETQVMALDLAGVSVSAGAACSSGKVRPSHVLEAMGESADVAGAAIRVSLGWNTTAPDIDRFLAAWTAMARRLVPSVAAV